MICNRSHSRPGFAGRPARNHFLRDSPPFHDRVVKPRISYEMPRRLQYSAMISAIEVATIARWLVIEPEWSISRLATVSLREASPTVDLIWAADSTATMLAAA